MSIIYAHINNASPKLLPDLEFQHPLWWDIHRRAGLGIAGRARLTMADAKAPEAAELNFLAAHERLGHRLEDRGDNVLALTLREAERLRQFIDQVSARHDDATPSLIFRFFVMQAAEKQKLHRRRSSSPSWSPLSSAPTSASRQSRGDAGAFRPSAGQRAPDPRFRR